MDIRNLAAMGDQDLLNVQANILLLYGFLFLHLSEGISDMCSVLMQRKSFQFVSSNCLIPNCEVCIVTVVQ